MIRTLLLLLILSAGSFLHAATPVMTPPKGWDCVSDPEQLPEKVEVIFVGAGKTQFTPSLNLACEPTELSVQEYLKLARSYHEGQGDTRCKDLGTIDTLAGKASLMQIDRPTQWGNVRFIQAVVLRDHNAYVITATCLADEFGSLSAQLFKSIQSFNLN